MAVERAVVVAGLEKAMVGRRCGCVISPCRCRCVQH